MYSKKSHLIFFTAIISFLILTIPSSGWASCTGLEGEALKKCEEETDQILSKLQAELQWKTDHLCKALKDQQLEECLSRALTSEEQQLFEDSLKQNENKSLGY